ncbi:MAG: hypothetical protein R2845_10230 [Thermomicrobiales bacterium]
MGRFLYSDATNTVFIFMSIYATKEISFSDLRTRNVLLAGIIMVRQARFGPDPRSIGAVETD